MLVFWCWVPKLRWCCHSVHGWWSRVWVSTFVESFFVSRRKMALAGVTNALLFMRMCGRQDDCIARRLIIGLRFNQNLYTRLGGGQFVTAPTAVPVLTRTTEAGPTFGNRSSRLTRWKSLASVTVLLIIEIRGTEGSMTSDRSRVVAFPRVA